MKKYKTIAYILFAFTSNILFALNTGFDKVTLTGTVTDKANGETIVGAAIYILDLQTGALTDASGNYKIDNLPKAINLVQVSYVGYKTIIEKVDLKTLSVKNFELEQTVVEVNEVVVTGSSTTSEIRKSPVPIVAIDNRGIAQNLNTNIIDAIAKLPGINAVTTGPNVSKPFIRGLGYNRVLTMYDGVRQEGQQWGDEHGIEVDENTVEKIEVVKGPASLTYGSDALAGVVNLLPAHTVSNGSVKGDVSVNYQTNNRLIEGSAAIAGNENGVVWGGRVSHKQATNYQNKYDGRVYSTAFNETDANAMIGLNRSWGFSHFNFSIFNDLQEIPDGSRDSTTRKFTKQISEVDTFRPIVSESELNSFKIAALHQKVQHYKIYSSSNFILGESKLGIILSYQQNIRREFSHPENVSIPGLYLTLSSFTYDFKYYLPEVSGWEATLGLNGMYQTNSNKGTEFIIPNYDQFDIGPFVFIKKSLGKIDISAGIRYDNRIFKNDEMYTRQNLQTGFDMQEALPDTFGADHRFYKYRHTFSGISGSIGITYNISNELLVKANIGRGFRAPNISEISANGVHPGTNIYQIGNPDFKPEFSLQEDLGIFYSSYHVNGSAEIFNNNISNYILNQKLLDHLGNDSIIIKGDQTFKFQQAQAQLFGSEASLDIHPHPLDWLHFENSISIVYALNKGGNGIHVTDSSRYLPSIPPLHTNSQLRADIKKKFRHFSSLYIKLEMEYYAKQKRAYLANNTETPTAGYNLFNAGMGADITNSSGKVLFSIHISVNNITNVAYQSHLSRLKYFEQYPGNWTGRNGIFDMGRNIGFKIDVPLNIK
jgi:iron complex outermembrane recepter protein